MSNQGIDSTRGDIYQILIAFDWALTVLSDPSYEWIEVDSTLYFVDDVVIGKSDGSIICCQCKKNAPKHSEWSVSKMTDEFKKVSLTLSKHPRSQIRFYSRSPFGNLGRLRDYAVKCFNEFEYQENLPQIYKQIDQDLTKLICNQVTNISTYEFLKRTHFESSDDFDRLETKLYERLRYIVSNPDVAYSTLRTCMHDLWGRMEGEDLSTVTRHRLTKNDLKEVLQNAGVLLTPLIPIKKIKNSFASISAIGRYWHRDISGHQISNSLVNKLLGAIDNKQSTILLTGAPGSGKTCILLSLQEALEQRMKDQGDLVSLFIQSREFVDAETAQERQVQGLSEQWVEKVARLADETQVVVIIDSLDVLSIARERNALTYFLAQIDRLQLIPNITLITACREFDRKYDRRIAVREWDQELSCQPLDWNTEIEPLLTELNIDVNAIDTVTREIINNPRELSLFVELVQHNENLNTFNVVNSQALAQRYLQTIVQEDIELGDVATEAIEELANTMLETRSLSVPRQRFNVSQNILRRLFSLNVLQRNYNQEVTFGHQTLLDVLVINNAIRRGLTLSQFIRNLKPVPFVRPSIRSFVEQVATGDRRDFRKQIRTVLTGSSAFHIRRLVAESFAEQIPEDSDWSLIRELRNNHPEVLQVIYTQASSVEWHRFWLTHLVPILKETNDTDGLMTHINLIERWKDQDAAGVVSFWTDVFELDWLDKNRIVDQLSFCLQKFKTETLYLVTPLLKKLLGMPIAEHSFLGHVVARCLVNGLIDDEILWNYITGEINEEDITGLSISSKLRCSPDEFGSQNETFLKQRMSKSVILLDSAINAIERWSQIRSTHYPKESFAYDGGYIWDTSYSTKHSQTDHEYIDGFRILLNAAEVAIVNHAQQNSSWWQQNKTRLCFGQEGSFRYFSILALTESPQNNLNEISDLICDKRLLESELSYELGDLIQVSFGYLNVDTQNRSIQIILTIFDEYLEEEAKTGKHWILKRRAEYISAIPCYLRSEETQSVLDTYQKLYGELIRQPSIELSCGFVSAPFSYEELLNISNDNLVCLLQHYEKCDDKNRRDFLVGEKRDVGFQLREASSRYPSRFLRLLNVYWLKIGIEFRNEIMEGIANHLEYRFGNVKAQNPWQPLEEPEAATLVNQVFKHLEKHPDHWLLDFSAAKVIRACSHAIQDVYNAKRLVFLAIDFRRLEEKNTAIASSDDLITVAFNTTSGNIVQALMILANRLLEYDIELPELLVPTLKSFLRDENLELCALVLRYLPYLQSKEPDLGWDLFDLAMRNPKGLWQYAERCLYYSYRNQIETVKPLLEKIYHEGNAKDLETWGRISTLASLAEFIELDDLLSDLKTLDNAEAWKGATSVLSHPENIKRHSLQCIQGIESVLTLSNLDTNVITQNMSRIFRDDSSTLCLPQNLIQLYFDVCRSTNGHNHYFFGGWLNKVAQQDPALALNTTEVFLDFIQQNLSRYYDYEDQLAHLLTRLFAEAEEREESDGGSMLKRVVAVQDAMLSLGIKSVDDWLKMAERP